MKRAGADAAASAPGKSEDSLSRSRGSEAAQTRLALVELPEQALVFFRLGALGRDDLLRRNQRYIFFREGPETSSGSITSGPVGSMGSPLSSMVSLAVDRTTFPLGSVLAFDVNIPDPSSPVEEGPVSTTPLFGIGLAQDTGEAIRGRRVDLFCGKGARAAYIAGHLNGPGEIWMLLAK